VISYPSRLFVSLPTLLVALLFVAGPAFGGTAEGVSEVNSLLKRAETNLNMVNQSIGHLTSPPKGAAGRLAKMRFDQALDDLNPAGELLGNLPAKGQGVAEATDRYNTAAALASKLESILTGQAPKPAPKPGEAPAEPKPPKADGPKTVKLGYPHADNFKNVLFTLRHKVEAPANQITKLHAELLPIENQLTVDHRKTAAAMGTIKETLRQAGFVKDGLAKVPSNGQGVAEAYQRLADAHTQIDGSQKYFQPLNLKLIALVDITNYPEYRTDVKRLEELGAMYYNTSTLQQNRPYAAAVFKQSDAAKTEVIRIAQAYALLMHQQTGEGKRIEGSGNAFFQKHAEFLAAAEKEKEVLPDAIREDLKKTSEMADRAVAEQKPFFFTSGIPQMVSFAEDKLALYTVLDAENAPAFQAEMNALKAELKQREQSLAELIVKQNPLPRDSYTGDDREKIIAIAKDAWSHQQKDFEVLAVRIPSESWSRETLWTYSSRSWYFVDSSYLQVRLIIADPDKPDRAIDRPINITMNHQKGDTLTGSPLHPGDSPLQPRNYILRDKIK